MKVYPQPRNIAELGVSPRETAYPRLNYAVFDRCELKIMLLKDLEQIKDKMKTREGVLKKDQVEATSAIKV